MATQTVRQDIPLPWDEASRYNYRLTFRPKKKKLGFQEQSPRPSPSLMSNVGQ
ncbi:MAG: hypothetical protein AAFP20_24140 [Cyanobacteria bacterium J06614_10]